MKITLGYARTALASFVGEGHSPEEQIVVESINQAINWLLPKIKGGNVFCRYRFAISNNLITLPRECTSLIKLIVDGNLSNIQNRWFEFLGYGSGGFDFGGGYSYDVYHLGGGFPTFAEIPEPSRVIVISEREENGKYIKIMGLDENGKEVSERLQIRKEEPFYSTVKFSKIQNIIKDETESYVLLSTFRLDDKSRVNLGFYAPSETNPSYTRYYIKGFGRQETPKTAIGIVRLGFIPIKSNDEPLLIQNIPAISLMLKALHYYHTGEIEKAERYEMDAIRLIEEQIAAEEPQSNVIDFSETNILWDKYGI